MTRLPRALRLLGAVPALAGLALTRPGPSSAGYTAAVNPIFRDTIRTRTSRLPARSSGSARSAVIPGYLSSWGLPPVPGTFIVSDSGLIFHATEGSTSARASTVSLAYVDGKQNRAHYLFRIDAGVFETDTPGPLLDVAAHPLFSSPELKSAPATSGGTLVDGADSAALERKAQEIAHSSYADSLYALFGRPAAGVGVIGARGRRAGRLGEYIAARDSLALDPGRMTGEAQLRHALAHELGHRWQARARAQLAMLWSGVPPIRDPKRYGYGDVSEHEAEAIAFAVNFLQTTARFRGSLAGTLTLLDHYELLVPGTRTLVRYLALQPLYQRHPLRSVLTAGRPLQQNG